MEDFLLNKTILIVDDTPENIDVLQGLLADFKKKVATSGERALKIALSDNPPDLILLDIMMPEMDGYEVCRRLRKDERTKDVPVIFLSAKTAKEDIVNGLLVGGQDYVTKPFDSHELMERVKTQLELRHQKELLKNMNVVLEEKVKERTIELDKANKQLIVLDEAKNSFLNLISHEIRTPLNGIVGSTYFLSETINDPELTEFLDMLKESVDRLDNFSKTALEITQMRTVGKEMKKTKLNLSSIAKEVMGEYLDKAKEKGLIFRGQFADNDNMMGIKEYLKNAIDELVSNAVKFSHENTEVIIKTTVENGKVKLTTTDNGELIPHDRIEEIIKPFGLGKDHYDKNVGLGLTYVQAFLDIHNGQIEISSTTEETKFTLVFNTID